MPINDPELQNLPAKERIVKAALILFAKAPFSQTSLRDIAAASKVDVAYVHRAFGSKAEIFRQALYNLAPSPAQIFEGMSPHEHISRICDDVFKRDPQAIEDIKPLHLVMQSCTCSEARIIVADFVRDAFAIPLAKSFGHETTKCAMIAVCLMAGFVNMRLIVGHQELQAIPEDELKSMLSRTLYSIMAL